MAFTLAQRIQEKTKSSTFSGMGINLTNFEYHDPVVKDPNRLDPHLILVNAEANLENGEVHVEWFNPANEKWYCHATAYFEDSSIWLSDWARTTKLVTSRIEVLKTMSINGTANRLTTELAYTLFGKLVGYSSMYRTMQSVILNEDEAMAEVLFPEDAQGDWAVPPHFIDGLVSLSGFILNGGTHFDNTKNFFITPSWKSMRFAKPLTPGGRYLAYVRMVQQAADGNSNFGSYVGDVYIIEGGEIIGVVEAILFREWPRLMLNRFFCPASAAPAAVPTQKKQVVAQSGLSSSSSLQKTAIAPEMAPMNTGQPTPPATPQHRRAISKTDDASRVVPDLDYRALTPVGSPSSNSQIEKTDSEDGKETEAYDVASSAIVILAEELAVDKAFLTDECEITDIGLDSLMSLVISQKLRENLSIEIRDAFYLEVATIGDFKKLIS